MTDLSMILNNMNSLPQFLDMVQFQLTHMDKDTMVGLGYSCWLYIIMDGATRCSSRRNSYSRRRY